MWELRLKEIRNVSKVKRLVSAEAEVWAMQVTSAGPQAGLEVASWLGQTTTLPPPPVYETASCSLRERAVLLCPCLFHFFTEHSYWSWVSHSTEAGLIWLVQSPINLIGQDRGHSVQIQPIRDFVSGILGTGTRNQTQSSLIHGSSRCRAETWKPGAVGRHSLGKVEARGELSDGWAPDVGSAQSPAVSSSFLWFLVVRPYLSVSW